MTTTMSTTETVGAFLGAVLTHDPATMRQLANADYIQHNPYLPTGLEPFIEMLPVLQEHGTTAENIRMFQDGNYVFMHNIWRSATPFGADQLVSLDIIRVDDSGKVAEHWDAMTPLVEQTASGRTQTDGPVKSTDADKTEATTCSGSRTARPWSTGMSSSPCRSRTWPTTIRCSGSERTHLRHSTNRGKRR